MTVHLDTNFLIAVLQKEARELVALRTWIAAGGSVAICSIAWSEFMCGPFPPEHPSDARILLGEPLAFAAAEAELSARLFNLGGRRRGSLADCQIAAVAIRAGARLATVNRRDFAAYQSAGLVFAD